MSAGNFEPKNVMLFMFVLFFSLTSGCTTSPPEPAGGWICKTGLKIAVFFVGVILRVPALKAKTLVISIHLSKTQTWIAKTLFSLQFFRCFSPGDGFSETWRGNFSFKGKGSRKISDFERIWGKDGEPQFWKKATHKHIRPPHIVGTIPKNSLCFFVFSCPPVGSRHRSIRTTSLRKNHDHTTTMGSERVPNPVPSAGGDYILNPKQN